MGTVVIPDSDGHHSQHQKPNPPAVLCRARNPLFAGNGFTGNRLGQVHVFQTGHSRTPVELNFPKFGKYPERDVRLTADYRGDTAYPNPNAPPLGKTVPKLKRLL